MSPEYTTLLLVALSMFFGNDLGRRECSFRAKMILASWVGLLLVCIYFLALEKLYFNSPIIIFIYFLFLVYFYHYSQESFFYPFKRLFWIFPKTLWRRLRGNHKGKPDA